MSVDCKAKYRCKDCFYCVIYNNKYEKRCARCHFSRPFPDGFPEVSLDAFCGSLTLPGTMERPYLVSATMPPSLPPPPPADV
jgi:hypothetical protein